MVNFLKFEEDLREALQRLRTPGFIPPTSLCDVMGCVEGDTEGEVLVLILQAIAALKPESSLPNDRQPQRIYDFLYQRFVQGLNMEDIAEHLHMSVRNLQRIQPEAVHVLALHLWQKHRSTGAAANATDWQAQVEKELSSLVNSRPESASDVQQVITSLLELKERLFAIYGVDVEVGFIQPGIYAALHSSFLRQVVLSSIVRLAKLAAEPRIEIFAGLEDGKVKISISGQVSPGSLTEGMDMNSGIPILAGTVIEWIQKNERLFVQIWLPIPLQHTVLVIEDNLDVVHYYRRCTVGTPFHIVHALTVAEVNEIINNQMPEIIVLDVMMPEVDGWQMLTHLHETPETMHIPVIVCSIVQEPELAMALGAFRCLPKPVNFQLFVDALNQALHHSHSVGSSKASSNPKGA